MAFGDGSVGNYVMKVGATWMKSVSYIDTRNGSLLSLLTPFTRTLHEGSHLKTNTPTCRPHDHGLPSFWDCEKSMFVVSVPQSLVVVIAAWAVDQWFLCLHTWLSALLLTSTLLLPISFHSISQSDASPLFNLNTLNPKLSLCTACSSSCLLQ